MKMERFYNSNSVYVKDGNQEQMILNYIKENGSITNLQAIRDLGIMQCPARIWGLKRRGVNVQKKIKIVVDRYGQQKRIAEYYIVEEEGAV
jgi:hypothetical protein